MRFVICCISLVVTSSILIGCGQTGALQLPNDQNYDKRAKYLLYPDAKAPTQKEQQQQDTVPSTLTAPVSEPAV